MELEFLQWLRTRLPATATSGLGLHDDAAVLRVPPGRELVVTTDAIADGVHFLSGEHPAELIGRKALAVNLSDLAAMAATPLAAFVSVVVPRQGTAGLTADELLKCVYEGLLPLASEFEIELAGGDTNTSDGPLMIAVTALGTVAPDRAWRRSGARAGDAIVVTGPLGGSLLGHHLTFVPRVTEALDIAARYDVHAAMDISDGVSLDLARLCTASGMGAVIESGALPISAAALEMSARDGRSPLEHALHDGEDFELLLTLPADEAARLCADAPPACTMSRIGTITDDVGVWIELPTGRVPLVGGGYQHR